MNEYTTGYLLIEYGRDENRYNVFLRREDAEKMFIDKAREYASTNYDQEIIDNDEDDMEVLAEGGIYSPNGELLLEIVECIIHKEE